MMRTMTTLSFPLFPLGLVLPALVLVLHFAGRWASTITAAENNVFTLDCAQFRLSWS